MKPGVQNPHCRASFAMNASWIGCSLSPPMPSTVVTAFPDAAFAGNRQLATGTPSNSTVHPPQTPEPQTSFVPVRFNRSRITSASSASASSGSGFCSPLIVMVLLSASPVYAPSRMLSPARCCVCDRRPQHGRDLSQGSSRDTSFEIRQRVYARFHLNHTHGVGDSHCASSSWHRDGTSLHKQTDAVQAG